MHLAYLKIKNLRGIIAEEFSFYDYTTIIGPNNCCKSTILRAIQLFLTQDKPDPDEWNISAAKGAVIEIEAHFSGITDPERVLPGIAALVFENLMRLKVTYTVSEDAVTPEYTAYVQEEDISGFAEAWADVAPELKELAKGVGVGGSQWKSANSKEKVRQQVREKLPHLIKKGEVSWSDASISIPAALKQGLPRAFIIPAVRDAKDESKITQRKNHFSEMFRHAVVPDLEGTQEYKDIKEAASKLRDKIHANQELKKIAELTEAVSGTASDIIELSLSLSVDVPQLADVFGPSACFVVDDGHGRTSVGLQGHGAQRSLIFALIEYMAKRGDLKKDQPDTRPIMILFEEPELYIHPHLLRLLRSSLKRMSQRVAWQVIVTTHSPIMIDVAEHPQSLIICRRNGKGVLGKTQLMHDPFAHDGERNDREVLRAALDFNPTVCEAFFAEQAVLVEGDSELAVLSWAGRLFEARKVTRKISAVTVISCDGKWTILPICRLLKEFGIPTKIVYDTDVPPDVGAEELSSGEKGAKAANAAIEQLLTKDRLFAIEQTLEDLLYEKPGTRYNSDKPTKAWRRIGTIIKDGNFVPYERLLKLFDFAFPN